MKKPIAQQLSQRRNRLFISQKELAVEAKTSQQHVQRIESGTIFKTDTLERIASVMQLDVMLVPQEKADLVQAIIDAESPKAALAAVRQLVGNAKDVTKKVA